MNLPEVHDILVFDNLFINTKYCMRIQVKSYKNKYYGIPSDPICFESKLILKNRINLELNFIEIFK